jgi:hypothetical protein
MVLKKLSSKRSQGKYKVTNWRDYNEALKQRGSLTVWLSDDFEESWLANKDDKPKPSYRLCEFSVLFTEEELYQFLSLVEFQNGAFNPYQR